MFKNWNILKHTLTSIIISLGIGIISYFIIKPTNQSSTIGIISGEGPSAIYTDFGFDTVIQVSIVAFAISMICYKFFKKVIH